MEDRVIPRQASLEEKAFLQEIRSTPGDDFPRHVYADWLEERGDPRAALIRIQCELEELPSSDPRRRELEAENFLLLREHIHDWVPEVTFPPSAIPNLPGYFRRGFLRRLALNSSTFIRQAESLMGKHPELCELHLNVDGPLTEVGRKKELRQITHLTLSGGLNDDRIAQLLVSPHLENLEHLSVANTLLEDHGAKAISNSPQLSNLKSLDLSRCEAIDGEGLDLIVTSPNLRKLETLNLTRRVQNPLPMSLRQLRWLVRLNSLDLTGANVNNRDLKFLSNGDGPRSLKHLILDRNRFNTNTLSGVLSSPILKGLETLSLANTMLSDEPVFWTRQMSANLSQITSLSLFALPLKSRDLDLISEWDVLARITKLNLGHLQDRNWINAILRQPIPELRELNLSQGSTSAQGVELLAGNFSLSQLESLDLSLTQFNGNRNALRGLASSPALSVSLRELKLANCQIEDAELAAFIQFNALSNLRRLSLAGNRISPAGVRLLAEWPRVGELDEVNLSSCSLERDGIQALVHMPPPKCPVSWMLSGNKIGNAGADLLMKYSREHFRSLQVKSGNELTKVKIGDLDRHFGADVVQF